MEQSSGKVAAVVEDSLAAAAAAACCISWRSGRSQDAPVEQMVVCVREFLAAAQQPDKQ